MGIPCFHVSFGLGESFALPALRVAVAFVTAGRPNIRSLYCVSQPFSNIAVASGGAWRHLNSARRPWLSHGVTPYGNIEIVFRNQLLINGC